MNKLAQLPTINHCCLHTLTLHQPLLPPHYHAASTCCATLSRCSLFFLHSVTHRVTQLRTRTMLRLVSISPRWKYCARIIRSRGHCKRRFAIVATRQSISLTNAPTRCNPSPNNTTGLPPNQRTGVTTTIRTQ